MIKCLVFLKRIDSLSLSEKLFPKRGRKQQVALSWEYMLSKEEETPD
jgi:hypothetical protein